MLFGRMSRNQRVPFSCVHVLYGSPQIPCIATMSGNRGSVWSSPRSGVKLNRPSFRRGGGWVGVKVELGGVVELPGTVAEEIVWLKLGVAVEVPRPLDVDCPRFHGHFKRDFFFS